MGMGNFEIKWTVVWTVRHWFFIGWFLIIDGDWCGGLIVWW